MKIRATRNNSEYGIVIEVKSKSEDQAIAEARQKIGELYGQDRLAEFDFEVAGKKSTFVA